MNPVNDPDVVFLADHSVLLAIPRSSLRSWWPDW